MPKTLIAFGYHDTESPRHRTVLEHFERQGWTVKECHTQKRGLRAKYKDLTAQWKTVADDADAVLVTHPAQYIAPLAWWLTRKRKQKIFLDACVSLFDTIVTDRKLVSRFHPYAWWLYFIDWLACHLSHKVLVDTKANKKYFEQTFRLTDSQVEVVYLDALKDLFYPSRNQKQRPKGDPLSVFFYGNYIPLQGVDIIIHAAALLEKKNLPIHFTLVGGGQNYKSIQQLKEKLESKNIIFVPFLPLPKLADEMRQADLCLGIFGTTDKAARVIPHKVYDAVACGIPVITADTPAIHERQWPEGCVILCPPGNPKALAEAIAAQYEKDILHT
jgi:glycosyltransferase involved in cell wall biosynthesis